VIVGWRKVASQQVTRRDDMIDTHVMRGRDNKIVF
jgi:hypothetical protein